MTGFVSFYFILWLRFYFEDVLSLSSDRQWSVQVLWRNYQVPGAPWPFSTVVDPAVNLGQCVLLEMGVGSPPRAPAMVGLGEPVSRPCHAPQLAGTLMTDWTGRMSILGLWRMNHNVLKTLDLAQRLSAVRLSSPFPCEVLKGIKERWWWWCRVLGQPYFPSRNCTFWLNPLFSWVVSSSVQYRALQGVGWPGQAGSPGLHFKEAFGSEGLNQGNHAVPGVWSEAGFGRVASKPSCWSAPRTQILESSQTSSRQQFHGSHPFPLQFVRKPWWWVSSCQIPHGYYALPTSSSQREGLERFL